MLRVSAAPVASTIRHARLQAGLLDFMHAPACRRPFSVTVRAMNGQDQRARLKSELITAMKSKNAFATTVLRSVLAEVQSADKGAAGPTTSSQITSIIKKGIARRNASAEQFIAASRPELAEKEKSEIELLATLLPPAMPIAEVDSIMQRIVQEQGLAGHDLKRGMGLLLKAFFSEVDKSLVDGKVVKERAQKAVEAAK